MSKKDLQMICRGLLIKLSAAAKIAAFVILIVGWFATEGGCFNCALKCIIAGGLMQAAVIYIDKLLY